MLGVFPVQIWSDHILPMLTYYQLKTFQIVSQVSKNLTHLPALAEKMFRSDVNPALLKSIEVGTDLKTSHQLSKSAAGFINPFLENASVGCALDYKSAYVYASGNDSYNPARTHGIRHFKARFENATDPPVSEIKLDIEPPSTVFPGSFKKEVCKVVGTGRPIFGGRVNSVTCRDVILAFCKYAKRFSYCELFLVTSLSFNTHLQLLQSFFRRRPLYALLWF